MGRDGEIFRDGERWGEGLKEMLRGRDRDAEREGKRWGEGGKEMGIWFERWFRITHWSKWSHRFSMVLREIERDGKRWGEMERHGETWGEI